MTTILIVEDEAAIADNISFALEQKGFATVHRVTAHEGLEALEAHSPDLAILDVGLPDFDGFELCKRIRAQSSMPLLFLTARSEEIDRITGFALGGDDYVTKPFSPLELAARVEAILRRSQNCDDSNKDILKIGEITLDMPRRRLSYGQQNCEVTRYEFDILCMLARRPGIVFSREQIMREIWDDPAASFDRTVDAHIKSIRGKLRKLAPEMDIIKTHRGIGYSLNIAD